MQKTIIFDLDGTLIDSSDGIVEAFNYAMTQNGLKSQPRDEIVKLIGFPLDYMFGQYTNSNSESLKIHFQTRAVQVVVNSTNPLDGADETVVSLFDSGYKLGIATTKIRSHINGILNKLGWEKYFCKVLGGDEVTMVKPDPEMFSSLMALMKADPVNTVIIGDTVNDILPAKQLSVRSVAVKSPYGDSKEVMSLNPDFFIEEIAHLPQILNKIFENGN